MLNNKKKLFIVAGVLIIIGLIVCFVGFSMLEFDISRLSWSYGRYTKTEDIYDAKDIESLKILIESSSVDVIMKPSSDNNIKLSYSPEYFNVKMSDDALSVEKSNETPKKKWYHFVTLSFGFEDYSYLKIELPHDILRDLRIESNYGDVNISGMSEIESFYLDSGSSDVTLNDLNIIGTAQILSKYGNIKITDTIIDGECSIRGGSGNLSIDGTFIRDLESSLSYGNCKIKKIDGNYMNIESSSGDIGIDNISLKTALNINSKYGNIQLDDISSPMIEIRSGSGNVDIDSAFLKTSLKVNSKYGNIRLDDINSPMIELKSGSGDIEGNINDYERAYKISSFSKSGDNNLKSKYEGSKVLKIESDYGNIKIYFKE